MRRLLVLFLVAPAVLGLSGSAAHAAGTVESGWWTSAPAGLAPDAPQDGLVVQGGADQTTPVAYAAIHFTGAADELPTSLKLTVASGSASTPNTALVACPASGSFTPAQGGAAADGPKFDCSSTKADGTLAADGTSYTFAIDKLASGGDTTIAIVPTAPTDRVVLARPGPDAVTTSAGSGGGSSSSGSTSGGTSDSGALTGTSSDSGTGTAGGGTAPALATGSSDTSGGAPLPAVTDSGSPVGDAPSASSGTPAASDAAATPSASAPTGSAAPAAGGTAAPALASTASSHGSGHSPLRGLLLVILALLAGSLWLVAGRGIGVGADDTDAATPG